MGGKTEIEHALEIAARVHEKQYRKGTDIPYISHPYAVGLLLLQAGCEDVVVIAGILHDTVEDTELTLECIRQQFDAQIADIVDSCSENKTLRWRERKTAGIKVLETASIEACLVVCADKLHNLRSIISEHRVHGDKVWKRFHGDIGEQGWYYRSILERLNQRANADNPQLGSMIQQLQHAVEQLFGEKQ